MIPGNQNYETEDEGLVPDFSGEAGPLLTYSMNIGKHTFVGRVDNTEAIRQSILKMVNTERYEHEIYSWDYGIELRDLYGKSMPYVMSEVKRRITDALNADERIEAVNDFTIEQVGKNALHCKFTVTTIQEETFRIESEVEV